MAEWLITGQAHGTWSMIIEADTEEEARAAAEATVESDLWIPTLDECDDVSVDRAQQMSSSKTAGRPES